MRAVRGLLLTSLILSITFYLIKEYSVESSHWKNEDTQAVQTIISEYKTDKVKVYGKEFGNYLVDIKGDSFLIKLNEDETKVKSITKQ